MDLREEARALIGDAIAPSTKRAYDAAFSKWAKFASENEYETLPASVEHILWYLAYLSELGASYGAAQTAVAAIADKHEKRVLVSPCAHPSVKRARVASAAGLQACPQHRPVRLPTQFWTGRWKP